MFDDFKRILWAAPDETLLGLGVIIVYLAVMLLSQFAQRSGNTILQKTAIAGQETLPAYRITETNHEPQPDSINTKTFLKLYPPMQTWRLYWLLLLSGAIYSAFWVYHSAKDLCDIAEKNRFYPKRYAIGILIPLVDLIVFYRMAKNIAELAKKQGITFKYSPKTLTGLFVLSDLIIELMPQFIYPLSVSLAAVPLLLLHRQMNCLRLAYSDNWHQPADRYTWRQLSMMIIGIPLICIMMYDNKAEFYYYKAKPLTSGQLISGYTPIYQLRIPDSDWRELPASTLYKNTDLELRTKSAWVIVRVNPNQQQTLNDKVDSSREVIASGWKHYQMTESRTLDASANLIPISLAHYTGEKGILNSRESMFVSTVVTPEHIIEVMGENPEGDGSSIQKLVESLHLTTIESNQ
ncbi:hypothetical protein [Methylomonas sp. AM2-LC]|uniref:hypothetical protein n=1 Tax=Methylomonas sp. AM2-LC TaxID=3153301 RepID=UPI003266618F